MPTGNSAQSGEQFVQSIVLQLEDDQLLADMSSAVQTLRGSLTSAGTQIDKASENLREMGNFSAQAFDFDLSDIGSAQAKLDDLVEEARNLAATNPDMDFGNAVAEIGQIRSALVGAENAQEQFTNQVKRYENAAEQAGDTATRSMRHTSQTSQNLLRIFQDAPFGILGVANNIQALAEDLGRAETQGRGMFNQLTQGFKNLIVGPFAIPAAITAITVLIQSWDQLRGAVRKFGNMLGIITDFSISLDEANEKLDEQIEKFNDLASIVDAITSLTGDEAAVVQRDLALALARTTQEINSTEKSLANLKESTKELAEEDYDEFRNQVNSINREMAVQSRSLIELEKAQKALQQAVKATAADSLQQLNLQQQLIEKYGLEEEVALRVAKALTEEKEAREEVNEQLDAGRRLRELEIEAMEDGLEKQLAQIALEFDEREEELQNEFGDTGLIGELIGLNNEIELKEKTEARTEAAYESAIETAERLSRDVDAVSVLLGATPAGTTDVVASRMVDQAKARVKRVKREVQAMLLRTERDISPSRGLFGLVQTESVAREQMRRRQQRVQAEGRGQIRQLIAERDLVQAQGAAGDISQVEAVSETARIEAAIIRIKRNAKDEKLDIEEEYQRERAEKIMSAGQQFIGNTEQVATGIFNIWKNERQKELEAQGKSEEEQREIMREEGKKRFAVMKAIRIADAIANGISATVAAYNAGLSTGIPGAGAALAASTAAATAVKIRQLKNLSIGDSLPGGGGGGGGASGEFTQLNAAQSARRAGNAGTNLTTTRNTNTPREDRMNQAADKIERAAQTIERQRVTIDERTSEQVVNNGQAASNKFNG